MPRLTIEDYHIGWICALESELAAGMAMFDEEHDMVLGQDRRDTNTYALGRIHDHNVVIACLPAGVDGTNAAATVAANLLHTFKMVRVGLLVGIGGGIPNLAKKRDIRLGDVVVSLPSESHGGVVQYDKGKRLANGEFKHKGQLNRPPTALLTALQRLRAKHLGDDSQIPQYLAAMIQKKPKMRETGFFYPEDCPDVLRCANCNPDNPTCNGCKDDCEGGKIQRKSRKDNVPEIHYGPIASGNQVVKSAVVRDRIRDDHNAICVEMEAAGLMNDFPCIVIRGICDYADAWKNDEWHNYAAATAAALAKELLQYVSVEQTNSERPIQQIVELIEHHAKDSREHFQQQEEHNKRQQTHNQRQDQHYKNDKQRNCLRALCTCVYSDYKNVNPDPVAGTCRWVLDHPMYHKWWHSLHNDVLWISADPGCGKSVLSKHLVESRFHVGEDKGTSTESSTDASPHTVCYFFFKDNENQNRLATALCAILHQLFLQQPQLIRHADDVYDRRGDQLLQDVDELWRILRSAMRDTEAESVSCVLDALDECRSGDRKRLIHLVCRFHEETSGQPLPSSHRGHLKILLTSRPYHDVEDGFDQLSTSLPSFRLRGEDQDDDIRQEIDLVVRANVEQLSRQYHLSLATKERLQRQLLKKGNRTYLWLYLVMEDITATLNDSTEPDTESFSTLPTSVEEAYEKILERGVRQRKADEVKTILTIIVGARRALTLDEMAMALKLATATDTLRSLSHLTISPEFLKSKIRDWCGLFIFFNHEKIYLIHQTAKEFLVSSGRLSGEPFGHNQWKYCLHPDKVEQVMAQICVTFLGLSECQDPETHGILGPVRWTCMTRNVPPSELQCSSIQSLFNFAVEFWAQHVRGADLVIEDILQHRILKLYDPSRKLYNHLVSACSKASFSRVIPHMDRIQFAAYNGHTNILRYLLQPRQNNAPAAHKRSPPIVLAGSQGYKDTVQLLLEQGADVNARNVYSDTALIMASMHGHKETVQLLLTAGADINTRSTFDGTAIDIALKNSHRVIVRLLRNAGAVHPRLLAPSSSIGSQTYTLDPPDLSLLLSISTYVKVDTVSNINPADGPTQDTQYSLSILENHTQSSESGSVTVPQSEKHPGESIADERPQILKYYDHSTNMICEETTSHATDSSNTLS